MITVFKKGSSGLDVNDAQATLVASDISGLIEIDKLNSHTDIEFSYPIVETDVVGMPLANNNLFCADTLICGSTITNKNFNESQYLNKECILNKDNSLYIIYSSVSDGSKLNIKGSDYMNVDTLKAMLDANIAQVAAIQSSVSNTSSIIQTAQNNINISVANAQSSMNTTVANAQTTLTNQINANKVNYDASMAKIKTDNEAYVAYYITTVGTTAVFA
jgi:hypothetical protein